MDGRTDGWVEKGRRIWMDGENKEDMDGWMYGWMNRLGWVRLG